LSLQTHSDTAIMADKKMYNSFVWQESSTPTAWRETNKAWYALNLRRDMDAHNWYGVNALYVGGHARWVPAKTGFPNASDGCLPCDAFPNVYPGNPYTLRDLNTTY